MSALEGVRVLDFTSRLPGPLAGLLLSEAGAEVVKIEPPAGDPLCSSLPGWPDAPATYAQLNRGKRVMRLDLKNASGRAQLEPLLQSLRRAARRLSAGRHGATRTRLRDARSR